LDEKNKDLYWHTTSASKTDYAIFKSIALIHLYAETCILPIYGEEAKELFDFYPRNFLTGMFAAEDYENEMRAVIIIDTWSTVDKIIYQMHLLGKASKYGEPINFIIVTVNNPEKLNHYLSYGKTINRRRYCTFSEFYSIRYYPELNDFYKTLV